VKRDQLLDSREVAAILRCHPQNIRDWLSAGSKPGLKACLKPQEDRKKLLFSERAILLYAGLLEDTEIIAKAL
jgi:transposase